MRASLGELDQRSRDAAINTELKALNPAFNPDNINDAKIKIQDVLDNINLFDQEEGERTPDVIDQIIEEIDSKKTPSDSNIFLDEFENQLNINIEILKNELANLKKEKQKIKNL